MLYENKSRKGQVFIKESQKNRVGRICPNQGGKKKKKISITGLREKKTHVIHRQPAVRGHIGAQKGKKKLMVLGRRAPTLKGDFVLYKGGKRKVSNAGQRGRGDNCQILPEGS